MISSLLRRIQYWSTGLGKIKNVIFYHEILRNRLTNINILYSIKCINQYIFFEKIY